MHVVFIEPRFPTNQRYFVRALKEVGATVTAIGEGSKDSLSGDMRELADPLRAGRLGGERGRGAARREVHPRQAPHRSPRGDGRGAHHVDRQGARGDGHRGHHGEDLVAVPRQALDEGGAAQRRRSLRAVDRGRARSTSWWPSPSRSASRSSSSRATAPAPRAPAACDSLADVARAATELGVDRGRSVAVEEFIEGHEGFYDTITIGGRVVHDFVTHYYPNVLEAMRTRWISPAVHRHQPGRLRSRLPGAQGDGPEGGARARHRHLGHAHGVVLRAQGPQVLRDRLPPARRARVGPLQRGQRHRPLPRVGDGRGARPPRRAASRAASRRASWPCGPSRTAASPATRAWTRSSAPSASG